MLFDLRQQYVFCFIAQSKFMKTLTQTEILQNEKTSDAGFAIDTTFVLFFLAVEFGQNLSNFGTDTILMLITLVAFAVLPYFLATHEIKFAGWVLGRVSIASFATMLGAAFNQMLGTVLPETFKYLPMTLLILTAMLSFYIQFYGFFKLRLAK